MYKLCFYVPESHLESVKSAVFTAGAGTMGNYEHCSWQVLGEGQFKPLQGSSPYIGDIEQLEKILEWRVETIVPNHKLQEVTQALKEAHPYETPAYNITKIENI